MPTGSPKYNYTSGYYKVGPYVGEETDPFKRLVAWRGLKIRSISILGDSINIECYKGKKTYFITINACEVKVFNNKKECIDTILIPMQYVPDSITKTTTTIGVPWVYTTDDTSATDVTWRENVTFDPQWTTTSNNTAASYKEFKIDFE
jgi:hypothetical protein